MYKNTNCFHLAIPCGDLEKAKNFYNEILGCRLDNSAQEWVDVNFWGNELTLHSSENKLENERHDVDMGNVSVPHFGIHLTRKDFDALRARIKENKVKYYDEPYLRFRGTKYEQETFFIQDPNYNILEIKTLTSNPD
jgi:extradiol dioxygenase family protein